MTRDWIAEYDIERAANVALLEELDRAIDARPGSVLADVRAFLEVKP
jgi:hypothetical protein